MSSKTTRLKAEHEKNEKKIESLRARNNEISKKITELENMDIIGLVREVGMTPEELAFFLQEVNGSKKEEKDEVAEDAE